MSNRVSKNSSKLSKTDQRLRFFAFIDEFGVKTMPCSMCEKKGWKCKMVAGIDRYSECVRRGRSCNGSGVSFSARRFSS